MTNSAPSTNRQRTATSPSHIVYHVHEQIGGNSIWTQIGYVWPHDDRAGVSIEINRSVPSSGRMIFRSVAEGIE